MNRLDGIYKEGKEHEIGLRCFTWSEEIDSCIGSHAPVVVFSTSVDTGKWFLMQQHPKFVSACHAIHHIHQQQVVINRNTHLFEHWRAFELRWGNLVMACAKRNT